MARQVRKFGGFGSPLAKKKAIIAVAHKLITIVWHVLTTGRPYQDLGADYFTSRLDPEIETRRLVAKLQALNTPSPSNPPPDHLNTRRHKITRLRRVASPAVVTSIHVPADGGTVSAAGCRLDDSGRQRRRLGKSKDHRDDLPQVVIEPSPVLCALPLLGRSGVVD